MTYLAYRDGTQPDELPVGTCTIRRAQDTDGRRFWLLWFFVERETDHVGELMAVRINPGGPAQPGTGEWDHVWGLARSGSGRWDVSPSINVLEEDPDAPRGQGCDGKPACPGEHPARRSVWHQTPTLIEVPEPPPWERPES